MFQDIGSIVLLMKKSLNQVGKTGISLCYAGCQHKEPGPEVIKLFFVLNSVEHEISNAHKYKNIKKFSFCQAQISGEGYFSCS